MRHETLSINELTVNKLKRGTVKSGSSFVLEVEHDKMIVPQIVPGSEASGRKVLEMMSASIVKQGGSVSFGIGPKGATIHKIEVAVSEAFNGTGASLLIGKTGDTDAYAAAGDIDETSATVQNVYPGATLTADTEVFATLTDPDGTTGAATMLLYYTL